MKRISREEYLMRCAFAAAMRSTCLRSPQGVGAVIAHESRIISTGYNEAVSGAPHCSAEICDLTQPCRRTVHAEANALIFAARHGQGVLGCDVFCTHAPCLECAKLMVNAGIRRVVWGTEYRDPAGLKLLQSCGIISENYRERYGSGKLPV